MPPPLQQQAPELNCGRSHQAGVSGVVRPALVTDQLLAVYHEGQEYVARVHGEQVGRFKTEDEAMEACVARHLLGGLVRGYI